MLLCFNMRAQRADTNRCCIDRPLEGLSLEKLGSKYRQMKKYRNTDCCQSSGSNIEKVMDIIKDSVNILKSKMSIDKLKEIMGEPDNIAYEKNEKIGKYKCMIYYWRSGHDYLSFRVSKKKVVGGIWFNAWE